MQRNRSVSRKSYVSAVCQFLISNVILNVSARPGFDSNFQNTFHSSSGKKENVTLTLDDIFPNYIITNEFCDDDSCKQSYEGANYPYEQITEVFPEVSKRLWEHAEPNVFSVSDLAEEDDEHKRTEAEGYNATFRMQGIPGTGVDPLIEANRKVPNYSYPDTKRINRCSEIRQTILPLTGKSAGKKYYITNIKTYSQTIAVIKCSRPGITCGNKSLDPEGITFNCKQEYEDAELSSFPVGESISLESHRTIPFKVPKGCTCSMSWL